MLANNCQANAGLKKIKPSSDTVKIFLLEKDTSFFDEEYSQAHVYGTIYNYSSFLEPKYLLLGCEVSGYDMGVAACHPTIKVKASTPDGTFLIYVHFILKRIYTIKGGELREVLLKDSTGDTHYLFPADSSRLRRYWATGK